MIPAVRARLALMMFLQYFVWGAWYVTLGTWLVATLHFSAERAGLISGTTALGAIVAPFFAGLLADRKWATEHLLAVLHAAGALLLLVGSCEVRFQTLYGTMLAYSLLFMPTLGLTNSLSFRHMSDPRTQFGPVRVFGTLGWIAAGLLVGGLAIEMSATPLRIAAAASLFLSFYCLTLPHTPPSATARKGALDIAPRDAIGLFRDRSFSIFAIAALLICVPLQAYYAFANLFLVETGVAHAAGKMTAGQFSELACMLLIPWFFRRLGVKYMLALGMLAWVLRYSLFAYGDSAGLIWMLWAGIILHGICYDFFFVVGQIYIDSRAPVTLRAAIQGLFTILTYGVGMLVGAWLSGVIVDHYAIESGNGVAHDWHSIWLIAAMSAGVILIVFLSSFRDTAHAAGHSESDASERPLPAEV